VYSGSTVTRISRKYLFLAVKKGGIEERIVLSSITNVRFEIMNPPRITLHLVETGQPGREIAFSPARAFAKWQTVDDLTLRANNARSARTL
jgi:hypothetical protein